MEHPFFPTWKALNWENLRTWHTHYKPKPVHDHIATWQELLAEYRQVVAEVLEIAQETGWRGPEEQVRLQWERRGGTVV